MKRLGLFLIAGIFYGIPVYSQIPDWQKQSVYLDFRTEGSWTDVVFSCIKDRVSTVDYLNVVNESAAYSVIETSMESEKSITATFTLLQRVSLDTHALGIIMYLDNLNYLSINEKYDEGSEDFDFIMDLNRALGENDYLHAINQEMVYVRSQVILQYGIHNIPDMCQDVTDFITENIPSYSEMEEYIRQQDGNE